MNEDKDLLSQKYSPAVTAAVRANTVSDVIDAKWELLCKRPDRVQFDDLEAIQARSEEYVHFCSDHSIIPSFQGLAAQLGISRVALYKYMRGHGDTPAGQYLERLRAFFTDIRIVATDKGASNPVSMIFLLKNGGEGYTDKVEIAPAEPDNPYQGVSEEVLKQRYLTDMAEDAE